MLHLIYFITRKPSLDNDSFHRYWRETHGPIVKQIPQLQRYIQSHQISGTSINSTYDGAAEAWVADDDALTALRNSSEFRQGALADEPNFIDMNRVEWLVTRDRIIVDGPVTPGAIKTISRVRRKQGLSVEEFRDHWRSIHGPIGARLPGVQRYVQCETVDAAYRHGEPRWDGVGLLWVKDIDALKTMRESDTYAVDALTDAAAFLDIGAISGFAAEEVRII